MVWILVVALLAAAVVVAGAGLESTAWTVVLVAMLIAGGDARHAPAARAVSVSPRG
jgi:hypothetical protein